MSAFALTASQRAFNDHVSAYSERRLVKLHWVVVNSMGLKASDTVYASADLRIYRVVAKRLGCRFTNSNSDATVTVLSQPPEGELINKLSRLTPGKRLVVFNNEHDIDGMSLRTFDVATACLFDQDSQMVVRIFDGVSAEIHEEIREKVKNGLSKQVREYIHIEMSELTDSFLSIQASRIAALR